MADEANNLVLAHLRDIRSQLDGIGSRFDKSDKDHDTFRYQLTHTFGMAAMAHTQAVRADEKADDALSLQFRTEERIAEVERRLKAIEETQRTR